MSGYITIISNKAFQLYGSDVYMICFTMDLDELLNFDSVYLDPNQIHFQSYVSDIGMIQLRINNELTYNRINSKKNFFMLPNLNNIRTLMRDLISEQKTLHIFEKPLQQLKSPQIKRVFKKDLKLQLDKNIYDSEEETADLDKKEFRQLLKVMPSESKH